MTEEAKTATPALAVRQDLEVGPNLWAGRPSVVGRPAPSLRALYLPGEPDRIVGWIDDERALTGERPDQGLIREARAVAGAVLADGSPNIANLIQRLADALASRPTLPADQGCRLPPDGWWCSREPCHDGPCAARPSVPAHCTAPDFCPSYPPEGRCFGCRLVVAESTLSPRQKEEPMLSKRSTGLIHKFDVRRVDGTDRPGQKHDGCDYFVLDLSHDPHAKAAILAYAESCADDYPVLAADLRVKVGPHPSALASRPTEAPQQETGDGLHTGDDDLLDALTEARAELEEITSDDSREDIAESVKSAIDALTKADALRVAELSRPTEAQ